MNSVQFSVCSVQCTVFSVKCSVQYVVCSVQCAVCSVQCVVCSFQCSVCSVYCAVCSVHTLAVQQSPLLPPDCDQTLQARSVGNSMDNGILLAITPFKFYATISGFNFKFFLSVKPPPPSLPPTSFLVFNLIIFSFWIWFKLLFSVWTPSNT